MKTDPPIETQGPKVDPLVTADSEVQVEPPVFNEQTHYVPVKTIITVSEIVKTSMAATHNVYRSS